MGMGGKVCSIKCFVAVLLSSVIVIITYHLSSSKIMSLSWMDANYSAKNPELGGAKSIFSLELHGWNNFHAIEHSHEENSTAETIFMTNTNSSLEYCKQKLHLEYLDYDTLKKLNIHAHPKACKRAICHFMNGTGRNAVPLLSSPGSGNTWIRGLLEKASGICTGSVYFDPRLKSEGFVGEAVTSGAALVVKSHTITPFRSQKVKSAILIVRNPYKSIVSDWNRARSHNKHTEVINTSSFGSNKDWDDYVIRRMTLLEYLYTSVFKKSEETKLFIVKYEAVQADKKKEVKKILDFLNVSSTNEMERHLQNDYTAFKSVCDYTTRYPEAVALKNIDAVTIADELVKIFSRVGIPQEILTDQGANFTSHLLTELYKMLHVRPIRTTPYHPQTDGLVERFNQTLKHMLRKSMGKGGSVRKTGIHYYLIYSLRIEKLNGVLTILTAVWTHSLRPTRPSRQGSTSSDESVVSHVLAIREKLEATMELVEVNLKSAQKKQREWYDQKARERELAPNYLVLILLPTSSNKLMAKWQGPYRVVKRVGKVDYMVDLHNRHKQRRVYHVNILKKWEPPLTDCCTAEITEEEDEFPDWKARQKEGLPKLGVQLTEEEQKERQDLIAEFADVLQENPGLNLLTFYKKILDELTWQSTESRQ